VNSEPPSQYHLPPQGGPSKPLCPSKTALSKIQNRFFCLFNTLTSGKDSGQMEIDFQNTREVFVHHGLKKKNLSQIFHRCHQLGEFKPFLSPFFQVSIFSCFGHDFAGVVSARWRRNWRNRRRFFSMKNSYTITYFSFYTGVTIEEKQMSECTPIISRFDPDFSSDLLGIYLLFSARMIEFDLLSLRIVFFIYIYVYRVKRMGVGLEKKQYQCWDVSSQ
jgi:hypothetical protein